MSKGKFKLYTASAGSGKTYTLVKEFLTLSLSSDNASCKDILAVTFTNKAANEMKAKILANLDGFINNDKKCDSMKNDVIKALKIDENTLIKRAKDLYDNILHNYSDFNISTIDGFIQQVSRSFSKELNLPSQYRVLLDDDDLLDGLIQSIDNHIDKDDKSITEILMDFVSFQLDEENSLRVDIAIKDFVAKLLKESAYKKGEILNLKEFTGDEYLQLKEFLNDFYDRCKTNVLNNIKTIRDLEDEFSIVSSDYNYGLRGLPSILNKINKDINVVPSSLVGTTIRQIFEGEKNWFSKNVNKQAVDAINKSGNDVLKLYKQLIENHEKLFLVNIVRKNLYLYALRGILLNIINQYIIDTNKVHISEFNKRISDVLGDCSIPFIYEKIGSRYKHFFIDEFQDTSLLQWHNFLPLVNNGLAENNMSLIVGDAKQAIYRFRNGEVEQIMNLPSIYGAVKNEFYEECENTLRNTLQKESLDCNYRSKKNIIEFNNSFFKLSKYKLTSENYLRVYADDLKQRYPVNHSYKGYVSVEIFDMDNLSKDESATPNKLYKEAVKESIFRDINVLKEKGFNLRDIAILVRSNFDGADIADFLTKKNIPVISSDSVLLKSSDKIRLIILTLKYLIDDKNDVTKLALSLYKNLCADPDSCDIQKALQYNFDVEKIYDIRNQSYTIYDMCCGIIKMYDFNILEDEFIQYFMNLVLEWQNTENNGIDAFIEYWDKKSDTFYVKITAEIDAVQIMTIHKSKGLEFKVVMYPYAYTKVPNNYRGGEMWVSLDNFELLKNIPGIDNFILPINKNILATNMEHYYTEDVEKSAFDDFNIMYVAMTRPSDLMFIYTKEKSKSDDDEKNDDSYNFFSDYFNSDKGYYVSNSAGDRVDVAEKEDVDLIVNRFQCLQKETSVKYELGEIICVKDNEEKDDKEILKLDTDDIQQTLKWTEVLEVEPDPTMFWIENEHEYFPKEWGNLVHEILSKIHSIEDSQKVLKQYVNDGSIDSRQAEKLQQQFEEIVRRDEVKAAYSKAAVVKNEMDILIRDADVNKIMRPDRYAELDDKVMLIDYKTGKHDERYNEKMKDYIFALQDLGIKKNIEAYLIYIGENIDVRQVFLDRLF